MVSIPSSKTVFFIWAGTIKVWINGDGVWCISLIVAALIFCKSTVHLDVPSFLGATTILEHQIVGVPTGTCSIMLNEMS